jgi:phytoene dehydrogenase-like protein
MGTDIKAEFSSLKTGASLLTLYLGFNKAPSELGNRFYSTCVFDSSVKTQADIFKNNNDSFERRSFIFVDYSQLDSGLAPAGKSVGAICCVDYIGGWEGMSKEDYNRKKEEVARVLIGRLGSVIPGIENCIEYYEVGTPATVERYTLNPGGAVYGFAQSPARISPDSIKSVESLHIASAWGKTGGGFSGAIYGGYLCAMGILRKRN